MRSNGFFCPLGCAFDAEANSGQDSTARDGDLEHFDLIGGPLDLVIFVTTEKVEDTIPALDRATQFTHPQAMAGANLHGFRINPALIEVDSTKMSQAVTGGYGLPPKAKGIEQQTATTPQWTEQFTVKFREAA